MNYRMFCLSVIVSINTMHAMEEEGKGRRLRLAAKRSALLRGRNLTARPFHFRTGERAERAGCAACHVKKDEPKSQKPNAHRKVPTQPEPFTLHGTRRAAHCYACAHAASESSEWGVRIRYSEVDEFRGIVRRVESLPVSEASSGSED